ncbi:MAG TPA: hypothetical protein VIG06_03355 [Kofleriaceae bacterium]|jgi:hypothetical protein
MRPALVVIALGAACGGGGGGSGAAGPEMPENATPDKEGAAEEVAVGYLAAGTVGQNPETGAHEFTGNPLAVAWVDGELRPLNDEADLDKAVDAFREAGAVAGLDGRGKPVAVAIGPGDPPAEGMFSMRLGGTVDGEPDARIALLALPGTSMQAVRWAQTPVPDATAAEQSRRLRAALQARPPHDECGDNTYDLVQDIGAASGARVGDDGPLAVTYKVTVNTRGGSSTGEALSALFLGADSSLEPPYLGLCRDHPAWRADPELAVRLDNRATFLLVISACGCEQEALQLVGTGH